MADSQLAEAREAFEVEKKQLQDSLSHVGNERYDAQLKQVRENALKQITDNKLAHEIQQQLLQAQFNRETEKREKQHKAELLEAQEDAEYQYIAMENAFEMEKMLIEASFT